MKIVKLLLASVISLTILLSCASSNLSGIGGTEFVVDLSQGKPENRDREDPMFIVKTTPQLLGKCTNNRDGKEPYMFWSGQCDFEGHIPDKVVIQYAKWKPFYQLPMPPQPYMKQFGDSLPDSAWQTYTLYPKKIIAEVKQAKNPEYTPVLIPKVIAKKLILFYLEINPDGSVSIGDDTVYGYTNNTEAYR